MRRSSLLVVVVPLILVACGERVSSTPATTPTPSALLTSAASATMSASAPMILDWQYAELAGAPWGGTPSAIAASSDRTVVVGGETCNVDGARCHGEVWSAATGETLEPVPVTPEMEVGDGHPIYPPNPGFFDVAAGPGGFVVPGYAAAGASGGIEARIWRSDDGLDWEAVEVGSVFTEAGSGVPVWATIEAGGPGYVIVGKVYGPESPRAAVWSSPDGRTWTAAPGQTAFDIGGYIQTGEVPSSGGIYDLATRDGELIAIGQWCAGASMEARGLTDCRAVVWRSDDAETWTLIDLTSGSELGSLVSLTSVAANDEQLVAVGRIYVNEDGFRPSEPTGFSLTSSDGLSWHSTILDSIPAFESITAVPGGFVALATSGGRLDVWTSADGVDWRELEGVPEVNAAFGIRALDAVVAGERLVIVGWAEPAGQPTFVAFVLSAEIALPTP